MSLSMPQNRMSRMMAPTSMPSAYQAMPTSTTSYQGANFMSSSLKQTMPTSMPLYGMSYGATSGTNSIPSLK